jgi:hypothetical protein
MEMLHLDLVRSQLNRRAAESARTYAHHAAIREERSHRRRRGLSAPAAPMAASPVELAH